MQANETPTILVAENDLDVRDYFELALEARGYHVVLAENGNEVTDYLRKGSRSVSLVLLNTIMLGKGDLDTYRQIRSIRCDLPIILVSGGASWLYTEQRLADLPPLILTKPVLYRELLQAVAKTLEGGEQKPRGRARVNSVTLHARPRGRRMQQIDTMLEEIGSSDAPVLLTGETGVGKEVLARQLHAHSSRTTGPFLKLNCAALPSELVESELFGYQKGAFTGAFKDSPGKFEMAQGGTILLDEIGDMDVRLQAKLLQVLQDGEFQRLGSSETAHVDVRIMAATHCDLRKAIREERFRADLYYRLNVISIQIPALRERKEEIIWLAEHFLMKHVGCGIAPSQISPELRQALLAYDWPGNVRELENTMRRYLALRREDLIIEEIRALATSTANERLNYEEFELHSVKHNAELEITLQALEKTHWNRKEAARLLKTNYKAFLYKMKKLGIDKTSTGPA